MQIGQAVVWRRGERQRIRTVGGLPDAPRQARLHRPMVGRPAPAQSAIWSEDKCEANRRSERAAETHTQKIANSRRRFQQQADELEGKLLSKRTLMPYSATPCQKHGHGRAHRAAHATPRLSRIGRNPRAGCRRSQTPETIGGERLRS